LTNIGLFQMQLMNIYIMQFILILPLRRFQTWSIFYMHSGKFNASKTQQTGFSQMDGTTRKKATLLRFLS